MTVWETVLVFAGLPLAGLALLAVLVFVPGATRRAPRYRVGRPWEHDPVWYVARPESAGPAGSAHGRASIAGPSRGELTGAPASVLDVPARTARGGASGEW